MHNFWPLGGAFLPHENLAHYSPDNLAMNKQCLVKYQTFLFSGFSERHTLLRQFHYHRFSTFQFWGTFQFEKKMI